MPRYKGHDTYIAQVLNDLPPSERATYNSFEIRDKRRYTSYCNNHRTHGIGTELKSPSEWFSAGYEMTNNEIAEALQMTPSAVSAYFAKGIRRIRWILANNPEKYRTLRQYLQ